MFYWKPGVAAAVAVLLLGCSDSTLSGAPSDAGRLIADAILEGVNAGGRTEETFDEEVLAAFFYDDGVVRYEPMTSGSPWYQMTITEHGRAVLNQQSQFTVESIRLSNIECWTEEEIKSCAGDADVVVTPSPEIAAMFDLEFPPTRTRFVLKRDPRVGEWRVENDSEMSRSAQHALGRLLQNALEQRRGTFSAQMERDRQTAVQQAYDAIFAALSREYRVNGDETVDVVGRGLQFARAPIWGPGFTQLLQACQRLAVGGHSDWRIPTEAEFATLFSRQGPRTYTVRDTPDHRIWGDAFAFQGLGQRPFAVDTFVLPLENRTARYQEITTHRGTVVAIHFYVLQTYLDARWAGDTRTYQEPARALCVRRVA